MGSMPLALSVHNFISSVGADAGFAAIIGLAVLILLYFAHARETARLRDEAEELSHRLLQAETRLAELSRQQVPAEAPAPASASQAARVGASRSITVARAEAAAAAVAAPAGVAAPPLAAATRVVPVAAPAEPAVGDGAERAAQGEEVAAGQGVRAMAAAAPVRERPVRPLGPAPATAAGAANGGGREPQVAAPVVAAERPVAPPRPRAPVRPAAAPGARRPALPPRGPARREGGPGRRFALLVGALIAVAAIAALVIITQSGGSTPARAGGSVTTNAPGTRQRRAAAPFSPSSVTVAVLNGTATNELAHRVAAKLTAQGYKQGAVATASNQTQSATVVAYRPGFRNDALHVATALKLGPAAVQPIDSSTQAVACPQPSPCAANVVVTVGQDLATL